MCVCREPMTAAAPPPTSPPLPLCLSAPLPLSLSASLPLPLCFSVSASLLLPAASLSARLRLGHAWPAHHPPASLPPCLPLTIAPTLAATLTRHDHPAGPSRTRGPPQPASKRGRCPSSGSTPYSRTRPSRARRCPRTGSRNSLVERRRRAGAYNGIDLRVTLRAR